LENCLDTLLLYIMMLELRKGTAVIFWDDVDILYMVDECIATSSLEHCN
jgi:hypothetical protein